MAGDRVSAVVTGPQWNPAARPMVYQDRSETKTCNALLPKDKWTKYFCQIAGRYHQGRFSYTRFETDNRRQVKPHERRVLGSPFKTELPYRLELDSAMILRDLDGPCLDDDVTLMQDLDEWWGNPFQRNKMASERKEVGPCSQWVNQHQHYDSVYVVAVDLTQMGETLFSRRREIPNGLLGWPDRPDFSAQAFRQMLNGLWSFNNYPAYPRRSDCVVWDTRVSKTEDQPVKTGRTGELWFEQYAADKFLKGYFNMAVVDLLNQAQTEEMEHSLFVDPVRQGLMNFTYVPGVTTSDNGQYEFGDFRTYGPQWVDYTPGYGILDLQKGHEYALVVFASDGGKRVTRFEFSHELRVDQDDVIAFRRIRPEEIKAGAKIVAYERPRVKIDREGKAKPFPPAGVITFRIRKNKSD